MNFSFSLYLFLCLSSLSPSHSLSLSLILYTSSDIDDLGPIGSCSCLQRLDISRNDLTCLKALSPLKQLVSLNVAANRISSLGKCVFQVRTFNLTPSLQGKSSPRNLMLNNYNGTEKSLIFFLRNRYTQCSVLVIQYCSHLL